MFEFRIINLPDGNQLIRQDLKTPYKSLTSSQLLEYMEVDGELAFMKRMERKRKREERKRKLLKNPLWRLANLFNIV